MVCQRLYKLLLQDPDDFCVVAAKIAHRAIISRIHPDKSSLAGATSATAMVNYAFDVLSDRFKRDLYHRTGVVSANEVFSTVEADRAIELVARVMSVPDTPRYARASIAGPAGGVGSRITPMYMSTPSTSRAAQGSSGQPITLDDYESDISDSETDSECDLVIAEDTPPSYEQVCSISLTESRPGLGDNVGLASDSSSSGVASGDALPTYEESLSAQSSESSVNPVSGPVRCSNSHSDSDDSAVGSDTRLRSNDSIGNSVDTHPQVLVPPIIDLTSCQGGFSMDTVAGPSRASTSHSSAPGLSVSSGSSGPAGISRSVPPQVSARDVIDLTSRQGDTSMGPVAGPCPGSTSRNVTVSSRVGPDTSLGSHGSGRNSRDATFRVVVREILDHTYRRGRLMFRVIWGPSGVTLWEGVECLLHEKVGLAKYLNDLRTSRSRRFPWLMRQYPYLAQVL